jgi:hypothetical protein
MMLLRELSEELQKALQSGYLHLHRRVQELETQLVAALAALKSTPCLCSWVCPSCKLTADYGSDPPTPLHCGQSATREWCLRCTVLANPTSSVLVARWRALEALVVEATAVCKAEERLNENSGEFGNWDRESALEEDLVVCIVRMANALAAVEATRSGGKEE